MLMCNLKRNGNGALKKGTKCVLKTGFVWCAQKLILKVKVVKYEFNVLNANSGLMKLAQLVGEESYICHNSFFWLHKLLFCL